MYRIVKKMAILFSKAFLNPNHYSSFWSIEEIQSCVEESCDELQVDFLYDPTLFSYYCITYYYYQEICFWIHLFRNEYESILEIEHRSGNAFGYTKVLSQLRYLFQEKKMIHTTYEPYQSIHEPIYEAVTPEYIRMLLQSDPSIESMYQLANLSLHPDMKQVMIDPFVMERLMQLSSNQDVNIHRCALAILGNLLHSTESEVVALFLQDHGMIHILNKRMDSSMTPQVKRECNLIYPFLE
jgi:hypothetical protein